MSEDKYPGEMSWSFYEQINTLNVSKNANGSWADWDVCYA